MISLFNQILRQRIAAIVGFSAVLAGALEAHGPLHRFLEAHQTLAIWHIAVFYQLLHAIILLILAFLAPRYPRTFVIFLFGIFFFCGSLYLFSLTGWHWTMYLTPLGGLGFLAAWACLFFAADKPAV